MNTNFDKNSRQNKRRAAYSAKKIAFASVMCAMNVVILFLGSIIETLDMSTAAIASFVTVICMLEVGTVYSVTVYAATSTLAFFMLPNKTVVLIYALFFGFYPILKRYFERLGCIFSWCAKLVLFNVVIFILLTVARTLFFPDIDGIKTSLVVLMNVIFFTLDLALSLFVTAYARRFRSLLQIHRFFK